MQLSCRKPSKDFLRVIRKPSQLSLPYAPSHLSKLIFYPFPLYAFLQPLGPSVLSQWNYLVAPLGFAPAVNVFAHNAPHPTSPTSCLQRIRTFFPYCHSFFAEMAPSQRQVIMIIWKILLVNCFKCPLALIPCIPLITIQKGLIFIFVNLMSILPNLNDKSHESGDLTCLMSWHTDSSKCLR